VALIARTVRVIDAFNEGIGQALSWLTLAVVVLVFLTASLRYFAGVGGAALYEGALWLHGIVLMGASGYCLRHGGHVRIDVFYGAASARTRAAIDLAGVLLLLWPTCAFVFRFALPYVAVSYRLGERSVDPDGLSSIWLLKSMILVFCVVLALQGLALALRSVCVLIGRPLPSDAAPSGDAIRPAA
jgi:TRAP-type mannitol/chloroaromatic compound transport system permease small subunit